MIMVSDLEEYIRLEIKKNQTNRRASWNQSSKTREAW